MVAATLVGIFLIPGLYTAFQTMREATSRRIKARKHRPDSEPEKTREVTS